MKAPSGYGGIDRLKGNRRKPYRVRITTGFEVGEDGRARQIQRTIGTYATYQEAVDALAAYNKNPVALDPGITFAEVYRQYSERYARYLAQNTVSAYNSAFAALQTLHDQPFRKLRRADLQQAIDASGRSFAMLTTMQAVLRGMYKHAMKNDIVDRDYSRDIDIAKYKPTKEEKKAHPKIHKPFAEDELAVLWSRADDSFVRKVLMLCYSGLRISEFLALEPGDIDIEARIIALEQAKTPSGVRRVPIAEKTAAMWAEHRASIRPDPRSYRAQYEDFSTALSAKMTELGLSAHLPHDTRYTASTLMHRAKIDLLVRKRILGHKVDDITEGVYTDVSDAEKLDAINRL